MQLKLFTASHDRVNGKDRPYMQPPPNPLNALKAKSIAGVVENPATRLPIASKPRHVRRSGFRPNMSLKRPLTSWKLVLAIKKLAATHDMDGPNFRPDPMAGTAVETDV